MKRSFKYLGVKTFLNPLILLVLSVSTASAQYILNQTTQQTADFNISGSGAANIFNAVTEYRLNGFRILYGSGGNLFTGISSGNANTTGVNNSFIGFGAGYLNTSGNHNTFVGTYAGLSNTTGYSNSFFGSSAGYDNTTGSQNLFAGFQAGVNNTVGYDNLFLGAGAGYLNTNGFYNSFIGSNAGSNTSTGVNNTFVGRLAGINNQTGNANTVIGASADLGATNLIFATAIGAGAVVSTSNTILLGRTDGSDKVRIYGLGAAGSTQLCRNASYQIATCSSSLRYKTNITQFFGGLNVIRQLRPIAFEWKDGGMRDVGFGAEEVARVDPLFVSYNERGEVEGVKYDRLSVVFVNAFNEQQTAIEALQKQIAALKKLVCTRNAAAKVCKEER